jgi:hypothetical protein
MLPTGTEMKKLPQQAGFTGIQIVEKQGSCLNTSKQ